MYFRIRWFVSVSLRAVYLIDEGGKILFNLFLSLKLSLLNKSAVVIISIILDDAFFGRLLNIED